MFPSSEDTAIGVLESPIACEGEREEVLRCALLRALVFNRQHNEWSLVRAQYAYRAPSWTFRCVQS